MLTRSAFDSRLRVSGEVVMLQQVLVSALLVALCAFRFAVKVALLPALSSILLRLPS